jgi:hypothetical protein
MGPRREDGSKVVHSRLVRGAALAAAVLLGADRAGAGEPAAVPRLFTHESYVEDVLRATKLPIDDPLAMFAYVLGALPSRVTVYPTENYYYFKFVYQNVTYAGNIRLDAMDRDEGKLHFAYYEDLAEWKDQSPVNYVALDMAQGVAVEKLDRLLYRVSYRDKTVVFALNDLSGVKPPPGVLGPDEVYLGPIFDDSAVRFFLVYNRRLKIFHYILDETVPATDQLAPALATDRILIGKRTGFAYYRDRRIERKILIGVFTGNARVNNYFDGPFDQLPDNFIEGDTLQKIILDIDPSLAGKIDRLGGSAGGAERFLISPYMHYRDEDELLAFDRCATNPKVEPARYYACFVIDPNAEENGPVALARDGAARKHRFHARTTRH